jgi:histidinol-phosphatase (PHP family)
MVILGDYHAHTKFCDGKNSCDEMVTAALAHGFGSVGISSHSYTPFDGGFGMPPDATGLYKAEMSRLKDAYRGKIGIYLGIEQEVWSEKAVGYDYIIGAAHYIKVGGDTVTVDVSADLVGKGVRKYFGGDWMKYIHAYYELAAEIPVLTGCDFIAHFDLVTKCNDGNRFFDEDSREYQSIAYEALKNAAAGCRIFEMNSGAVCRKYRSCVYPAKFLLKSMRELGCEIILSSDAHDTASLGFMFSEMAELAKECGFKSAMYLTPQGFKNYLL